MAASAGFGSNNGFSPNSVVAVGTGATLAVNGFGPVIAGLSGAGSVTLNDSVGDEGALGVAPAKGVNSVFSGVISDAGTNSTLTIGGVGTQTLSGVNTFTGISPPSSAASPS